MRKYNALMFTEFQELPDGFIRVFNHNELQDNLYDILDLNSGIFDENNNNLCPQVIN